MKSEKKCAKMICVTGLVTLSMIMMVACSNEKKDDKKEADTTAVQTTTVAEESSESTTQSVEEVTTPEIPENNITYTGNDTKVTDASVLGENVFVFSPDDDASAVQEKISEIYNKQESNQFGKERYELLFMPGVYDSSIEVNVGYYTVAAGLGISPLETDLQKLWVNADWMYHNATCNFWRSSENFSVNEFCMWATSQAVSLRRMNFNDGIVFSDGEGWSSGGFLADSKVADTVYSGSQQQWLSRNDEWRWWEGGVWNMVFVGIDKNRIPSANWPMMPYTKVEQTPAISEKPYIVYDENEGFGIMIPERRTDAQGTSWKEGVTGTFVGLGSFYIAKPDTDNAATINAALAEGKNILFTPGIYEIEDTIKVENPDTIIYGMGLATLASANGNVIMEIADVDGVKMCGMLFEAGNTNTPNLLVVGPEKSDVSHSDNPIMLSDVYFRVGGSDYTGLTDACITINANDIQGDNFWVWRADHGSNVGWDVNKAKNGIIINGDNATIYGLFVDHFQEYQTIWNGNGGKLYFYQSELPYDVPNQDEYKSHDGTVNGFASYKVGDDVTSHEAWGLGVYAYNRDAEIEEYSAIEVPDVNGVVINDAISVVLNGHPGITHVVNEEGNAVSRAGNTAKITRYENKEKK